MFRVCRAHWLSGFFYGIAAGMIVLTVIAIVTAPIDGDDGDDGGEPSPGRSPAPRNRLPLPSPELN